MSLLRCLAALALATLLVGHVYAGQLNSNVKVDSKIQRCHPAVCGR